MTVEKTAFWSGNMCLLPASVINKKSTDSVFIFTKGDQMTLPSSENMNTWLVTYSPQLQELFRSAPYPLLDTAFCVSCSSENPRSSYYIVNLTCLLICKTGGDDASILVL